MTSWPYRPILNFNARHRRQLFCDTKSFTLSRKKKLKNCTLLAGLDPSELELDNRTLQALQSHDELDYPLIRIGKSVPCTLETYLRCGPSFLTARSSWLFWPLSRSPWYSRAGGHLPARRLLANLALRLFQEGPPRVLQQRSAPMRRLLRTHMHRLGQVAGADVYTTTLIKYTRHSSRRRSL